MEYEVRFYYESEELKNILKGLKGESGLKEQPRTYEKTIQYNHSDERFDFYSKEIDGRFRLRISANDNETKCKLSWKRRLKATTETEVNKEEEKEVRINPNDIDNFLFIIMKVMKDIELYLKMMKLKYLLMNTLLEYVLRLKIKVQQRILKM